MPRPLSVSEALAAIQDDLCWEYKVLLTWSNVSAGLASFSISETEIEDKDHFKCAASTCWRHETHHTSLDTLLLLRRGWWRKGGGYLICNGRIKIKVPTYFWQRSQSKHSIFAILDYETEIGGWRSNIIVTIILWIGIRCLRIWACELVFNDNWTGSTGVWKGLFPWVFLSIKPEA